MNRHREGDGSINTLRESAERQSSLYEHSSSDSRDRRHVTFKVLSIFPTSSTKHKRYVSSRVSSCDGGSKFVPLSEPIQQHALGGNNAVPNLVAYVAIAVELYSRSNRN
jgi:hypothetical protein